MVDISSLKPFYSTLILAFACSALVALAAVGLRPMQDDNRALDQKKNILIAGGLYDENKTVTEMFANIKTRLVDLPSGKFIPEDELSVEDYDPAKYRLDSDKSTLLNKEDDKAKIRRRENISLVYMVYDGASLSQVILPVRGKGLWSTMYAYVAIGGDLSTISGVSFYEHGETPGLGGEIENPRWQDAWNGKEIYAQNGNTAFSVAKTKADPKNIHQIDGLSGATFTAKGVGDLMLFWFGDNGFKPFLEQLALARNN